jgi:hypothetical protein
MSFQSDAFQGGAFQTGAKQTKSEDEIRAMIMEEVRQHPECANVEGVAFTRPVNSNWDVAWGLDGAPSSSQCQIVVGPYIEQLKQRYDLA